MSLPIISRTDKFSTDVRISTRNPGTNLSLHRRDYEPRFPHEPKPVFDHDVIEVTVHGHGFEASATVEAEAFRGAALALTSDVGDRELRAFAQIADALTDPYLSYWLRTWIKLQRGAIVKAGPR